MNDDSTRTASAQGSGNTDSVETRLPRRLAAVLYADVASYSRLSGEDEDATHQTLRRYLDLFEVEVHSHRGQVAHFAGDAVLARFDATLDALNCALDVQRGLAELNAGLPVDRRVKFRIGVNSGDIIEDRGDIYGDGVNVAARLEALAEPGEVCISDAVRVAVGNRVAAEFQFTGEQRVKNIAEPIRTYRVALPGQTNLLTAPAGTLNAPPGLPGKPSLLMKPFMNLSPDPEEAYFAEGLSKDIAIALVKIPGLFLAMDESPREGRSRQLSNGEIGTTFGVRYVLDGGVRRQGQRVRVNAQLIETASGQCVWADRYDRDLHDLFMIQDEITEEIVTAMDVKLVQGEAARFMRRALTRPDALDASYKGWHALYGGEGKQGIRKAQQHFEAVIQLEPKAAIGYASAALAYWAEAGFGRIPPPSPAMEKAEALAQRALELGDNSGYAYLILALGHLSRRDFEAAMSMASEGVTARPSCNGAYAIKSCVLNYLGRSEEAIEYARFAVRLTPVYPAEFPAILANAYHDSGRHENAIEAARASLELRPDDIDPMLILAASLAALNRADEAKQIARRILDLQPGFDLEAFARAQPYREHCRLDRLLDHLVSAGIGN